MLDFHCERRGNASVHTNPENLSFTIFTPFHIPYIRVRYDNYIRILRVCIWFCYQELFPVMMLCGGGNTPCPTSLSTWKMENYLYDILYRFGLRLYAYLYFPTQFPLFSRMDGILYFVL